MSAIIWQYRESSLYEWKPYDTKVSSLLETEFQKHRKVIMASDKKRVISLETYTDRDLQSNKTYSIRRFVSQEHRLYNKSP